VREEKESRGILKGQAIKKARPPTAPKKPVGGRRKSKRKSAGQQKSLSKSLRQGRSSSITSSPEKSGTIPRDLEDPSLGGRAKVHLGSLVKGSKTALVLTNVQESNRPDLVPNLSRQA